MIRSVAVLLFGLAVVSAQFNPNKPDAVIVKKFYGNVPSPAPYYQQQQGAYYNQQNYYNQYRSPSPVPVAPAPPKAPVYSAASPKSGASDKDARILSEERDVNFDGTFKYAYQTDNGIAVNAEGFVKPPTADSEGPIQVIQGSYVSYTPEGIPVQISYIADENGYRAAGDAIPTPPPELAQAYANAPVEKQ